LSLQMQGQELILYSCGATRLDTYIRAHS